MCSKTITGPVVFTPAKDGADKVIAPVAGTPIVLPGVAANGETAVVATIAYTTQDDTTNDLTKVVRTGVTWAQADGGNGTTVSEATIAAALKLATDGNALAAAGGDNWEYYGKTTAAVAFDAAALTAPLPPTTMTKGGTGYPKGPIANPKFV